MKVSLPVTRDEKAELVEAYQNSDHKEQCAQGNSKAKYIAPCARAVRNGMVGRPTHLEMYIREQVFGDNLADDKNPTDDRDDDPTEDEDTDDSAQPRIPNDQARDDEGNFA